MLHLSLIVILPVLGVDSKPEERIQTLAIHRQWKAAKHVRRLEGHVPSRINKQPGYEDKSGSTEFRRRDGIGVRASLMELGISAAQSKEERGTGPLRGLKMRRGEHIIMKGLLGTTILEEDDSSGVGF